MKDRKKTKVVQLQHPTGGSSDRTLKKNIEPLENALQKVRALQPVTWHGGVHVVQLERPTGGASDMTLKQDVAPIDNALHKVLALRPVTWQWKQPQENEPALQSGFIAQEVEQIFPDMVQDGTWRDGSIRKHLDVRDMMPYLVEAVKEQQVQIDLLENRIKKLAK